MKIKELCSLLIFVLPLVALPVSAEPDEVVALRKDMPKDIAELISRIVYCNHWLGEEPYDEARSRQINEAIESLQCNRLDADEAGALKKYPKDARIKKAIDTAKKLSL